MRNIIKRGYGVIPWWNQNGTGRVSHSNKLNGKGPLIKGIRVRGNSEIAQSST